MIDEAVVLCGGRGQRLRPYTDHIPKPMLKVAGRPVLEYVVENLVRNGVRKAYFALGYLGDVIEKHFKDGSKWGIDIVYAYEEKPMNTAGALLNFKDKLPKDFFVVSGDHITTWNLAEMGRLHENKKPLVTIGLIRKAIVLDFGVAIVRDGYIKRFKEKPMEEYLINTGIYAVNKAVFDYIEVGKDFSKHVFPEILKDGKPIVAYVGDEYWLDIGRVHDYERINELLSAVRVETKLFALKSLSRGEERIVR